MSTPITAGTLTSQETAAPDSSIFGVRLDKPDPVETSSDEEKVVGYYLSNDDGSTVAENNAGGVRATEIIEDSDGNARLGDSACLGTIVHTTQQGLSWNRDSQGRFTVAVASSLSGTSGCLDEQDTAAYIAYHQQERDGFRREMAAAVRRERMVIPHGMT